MKSFEALNLPKQLYQALAELGLKGALKLKRVKKLAIDEVNGTLDLVQTTHGISFDTPAYPENYLHRIGRTGGMQRQGHALLCHTDKEESTRVAIEALMNYRMPQVLFPEDVIISNELPPEESPVKAEVGCKPDPDIKIKGGAFHEKKAKNRNTSQGGSHLRKTKK